jgi:hypothetical protein
MRRILVSSLFLLSLPPLVACNLFDAGTTTPEPQLDPAADREAKMKAAYETCKAGDDGGCAELYTFPEFMNQVHGDFQIEAKRESAMNVLRRACKGGNRHACTRAEQADLAAEYEAKQAKDKADYEAVRNAINLTHPTLKK